jgi:4-aminobutyrate aminotransferase
LGAAVFYVGQHSNVLELTPPITLSAAEVQEALQILDRSFEDVAAERVPDSALAGYAGW